ncbi:MAG: sugar phosphate isomerase/epimerase, partial [Armatimonadetes bacterium]|nr:sugar phosphate isomerase/epimerase [Armatimonadota bacterium]
DFRSPGRGGVDFEEIIRALNRVAYQGPLSVEWEDSGMDREHGAREAADFVRQIDFEPSRIAFDAQFAE